LGLYYESGDKLYVNIYAPSTAQWESAGVKLTMETSFPEGETVTLKLDLRESKSFTLALRRPSWAGEGFEARVNDKTVARTAAVLDISRSLERGYRATEITLTLPKSLKARAVKGTIPKKAAGSLGSARASPAISGAAPPVAMMAMATGFAPPRPILLRS
jgi:DUF1680 family protein